MDAPANIQPETKNFWTNRNIWILSLIISVISGGIIFYRQNQIIATQEKLDRELIELRTLQIHQAETDFALRLSGMKQTATVTENSMLDYYKRNLEITEHCRRIKTCNLPQNLVAVEPLPAYVPIAAIYLQEKEKLTKEH